MALVLLAILAGLWASERSRPGIGTRVRGRSFAFTVTGVAGGIDQIGSGFSAQQAIGQFFEVHVDVTNVTTRSAIFDATRQPVFAGGRSYLPRFDSDPALPSPVRTISPGGTVPVTITYDIPATAVPTSIRLSDSALSHGVTVSLRPRRTAVTV